MPEMAWIWDNLYSAQLSCAVCSILRQVRQSAIRICLHDNTLTWPIAVLVCKKCCGSLFCAGQRELVHKGACFDGKTVASDIKVRLDYSHCLKDLRLKWQYC